MANEKVNREELLKLHEHYEMVLRGELNFCFQYIKRAFPNSETLLHRDFRMLMKRKTILCSSFLAVSQKQGRLLSSFKGILCLSRSRANHGETWKQRRKI
jgi:hypothetical protein